MKQCPVCYHELEVRNCAPCYDCGGNPEELEHFRQGINVYKTYEVYKGLSLTLCNFCTVDFGSYQSEYFGLRNGKRIGFEDFVFVRDLADPQISKDKFCSPCAKRLKFLNFLTEVRSLDSNENA